VRQDVLHHHLAREPFGAIDDRAVHHRHPAFAELGDEPIPPELFRLRGLRGHGRPLTQHAPFGYPTSGPFDTLIRWKKRNLPPYILTFGESMPQVVGIDLGTTNSLVAFMRGERPEIIPNEAGKRLTPSVVGLDRSELLHVGETAKNQLVAMPDRTVAEVKRLMGTSQKVKLGPRDYTPQEVSGIILKKLKDDAERYLGQMLEEAVITVPAYFTDAQRQATKDAGELAGFKVDRILNEPTAAALAYGLDHLDKEQHILVYDLGGGTFDVSVLEMFEGVLDVKASAGNNHLGGGDFDRTIVEWICKQIETAHGVDMRRDPKAMARMKAAAEQAKMELSTVKSTQIMLPFIGAKGAEPISYEAEITRQQLEALLGDMIRSTLEPIEIAIKDAKLTKDKISDVVLVGGSSRIPLVQQLLAEFFKKEPRRGVNPDEAIALGAAVQAGLKSGTISTDRGIMITDVCPFTLGVEVVASTGYQKMGGMFSPIIPRNSTVPVSKTEVYSTTADNQRLVDIKIYQGESRLVKNNTFLDAYTVDGIPPGPAGNEKVGITFTYDVNGILHVSTKIVSTGKEAKLQVDKSSQRMTDKEREAAKDRLDREWSSEEKTDKGSPPPSMLPVSPATGGETGVKALLSAAQARLANVDGEKKAKLETMIAALKSAVVKNDQKEVARLDNELTNFLFDLD
jgi:molecular chaperone DnaK